MENINEPVMVDTSVWIAAFKGSPGDIKKRTRQLLNEDLVLVCGPILFEIRRGLRTPERKKILPLMEAVICLPFSEQDWDLAGDLDASLRSKGCTIPPMDILIAQICLRHQVPLFTLDKHFASIKSLKIFQS